MPLDTKCQVYESSKFPYKDDLLIIDNIDRNKSKIVYWMRIRGEM